MTGKVLRFAGAFGAGLVVVFLLVIAIEYVSYQIHPLPEDFDGTNEALRDHVALFPQGPLAVAGLAWGVTAFAGTWTAARLGNRATATTLGVLLVLAVITNVVQLPYPIWFKIGTPLLIPLASVWGYRLASRGAGEGEVASSV